MTSLLHGSGALLFAYTLVQTSLLAGLMRGRAGFGKLMLSPIAAAPLTAVAGVGIATATGLAHTLGLGAGGALQLSAAVGCTVALGYAVGRAWARRAGNIIRHERGAIVQEEGADRIPRARSSRGNARVHGRQSGGITLAGLPVAAEDEAKHFKLLGTTGTGKSTAIREMLTAALARGDRAVIADPDGGYLREFYDASRGDVILNPFDIRSAKWDLFGEITNDYDVDQLARSLIPDHEGPDRSWRGYARTFFSAVTAQAHAAGSHEVAELYRLLVVAGTAELKTLVAGTPAQPFLEEHNGRMFDSIRSVTSSAVSALDYVSRQRSAPLSVRAWVSGQPAASAGAPAVSQRSGVLFMPYRAGQIAALRSTISAWMRLAIFEAMNRDEGGTERLWFVVDELDALGQIDGLKDALARVRKFGGRCVLGFQSIAQVSATYGAGEAQTIVENCGNTLILRCSGSEHGGTSQFASRLIGDREVTRTTSSRSRRATEFIGSISQTEHTAIESAVMGSQIEQLPDLTGYLKLASSVAWQRVSLRSPAPSRRAESVRSSARILEFPSGSTPVARGAARCAQPPRESAAAAEGFELE
ncbi:MAG TPA: type IV secretion system DNA-binding domain-containing protein [Steroidobacteraceae bacterium]|nr:type IV secretion system DNA-binding domain-containing protein [Steroidobacteraceae bacterium]